jgi:hypothetical protein
MLLLIISTIFCFHDIVVNIEIRKGKNLVLVCMKLRKRLHLSKSAIVVERDYSCISQVRSILLFYLKGQSQCYKANEYT